MFGNSSDSSGGISPFGSMGEVIDNVSQFREKRDAELRHLNQVQQMGRAHHQEMMDLIGQYNELRQKYARTCLDRDLCAAARDAAFEILKENEDRLGLSHEEIGQRINGRIDQAQAEFEASLQK